MNKSYIVYNLQLAEYLIRQGYSIINISQNKNNKSKFVFFFKNKDGQIESFVNKYKNQCA